MSKCDLALLCKRYLDNYKQGSFSASVVTRGTIASSVAQASGEKMLQIARYPLPFNPTPVLCPLCTLPPGNARFSFQPCCFYPTETHPESQVHVPVNSLMSLRRSSFEPYRAPVRSVNGMPLASQNFHSPSNENITRVQRERSSGVGANQQGGKSKKFSLHLCFSLI